MTAPYILINGDFIPAEKASLHVSDLSIQRGYGIFDFFKTVAGRAIYLDDHLDRFHHSASRMRIEIGRSREELKALLLELIRKNNLPDSGVRITLTGGYSPDAYSIAAPNLIVTQQPRTINRELAMRGVRLITHPHRRQFADVKTIDYLLAVWLQPLIRERGADDVLYHQDGLLSECPRSNIFIVTPKNKIITPAEHVLKGIIRKHVLQFATARFAAEECAVTLNHLREAKEVFLTSTTRGVLPVVQIDGRPVGNGGAGEITRWLSGVLEEKMKDGE